MALIWLRVAVAFYAVGLVYALAALSRRSALFSRIIVPLAGAGAIFHFVSLVEFAAQTSQPVAASVQGAESLLALLLMVFFLIVFLRYRTTSPGILVFPLVFLLTSAAALGQQPAEASSPLLRSGWIYLHIALIFTGYAALFLSFAASVLYLVQERTLKSKQQGGSAMVARLPALEVIDEIGYRALLLGFPFMTVGLLVGSVIAQTRFGPSFFLDPKIMLSGLMWAVYMVLLYTRWTAGWRGRRAAYLATFAFVAAVVAWAANYFSGVHRFIAP